MADSDDNPSGEDDWAVGWALWASYRARHGTGIVPEDHSDETLVQWVKRQRHDFASWKRGETTFLSEDGFQMLTRMGFDWGDAAGDDKGARSKKGKEQPKKKLAQAHREPPDGAAAKRTPPIKSEHHSHREAETAKQPQQEGHKPKAAVSAKPHLTDAESQNWERRFLEVKAHQESKLARRKGKIYFDKKQLAWIYDQQMEHMRHKEGKTSSLSEDQFQRLDDIAIGSIDVSQAPQQKKWTKKYEQLFIHFEENGSLDGIKSRSGLGKLIREVRRQYDAFLAGLPSYITNDRMELLQALNFPFTSPYETKKRERSADEVSDDASKRQKTTPNDTNGASHLGDIQPAVVTSRLGERPADEVNNKASKLQKTTLDDTNGASHVGDINEPAVVTLQPGERPADEVSDEASKLQKTTPNDMDGASASRISDIHEPAVVTLRPRLNRGAKETVASGMTTHAIPNNVRLQRPIFPKYRSHFDFNLPPPEKGSAASKMRQMMPIVPIEEQNITISDVEKEFSHLMKCDEPLVPDRAAGISYTDARSNHIWEELFRELLIFKKLYGHTLVPKLYQENKRLAKFVCNTRGFKKKRDRGEVTPLTDSRLKRLEAIGFLFEVKGTAEFWRVQNERTRAKTDEWESYFQQLIKFKEKMSDCLVPKNYPPNQFLSNWVRRQRKLYRDKNMGLSHTLSDEREKRLLDVGFVFNTKNKAIRRHNLFKRFAGRWDSMLDRLLRFQKEYGHVLVPKRFEDRKLAAWVQRQRLQFKLKKAGKYNYLTDYRMKKLEKIGFRFEVGVKRTKVSAWEEDEIEDIYDVDEEKLRANRQMLHGEIGDEDGGDDGEDFDGEDFDGEDFDGEDDDGDGTETESDHSLDEHKDNESQAQKKVADACHKEEEQSSSVALRPRRQKDATTSRRKLPVRNTASVVKDEEEQDRGGEVAGKIDSKPASKSSPKPDARAPEDDAVEKERTRNERSKGRRGASDALKKSSEPTKRKITPAKGRVKTAASTPQSSVRRSSRESKKPQFFDLEVFPRAGFGGKPRATGATGTPPAEDKSRPPTEMDDRKRKTLSTEATTPKRTRRKTGSRGPEDTRKPSVSPSTDGNSPGTGSEASGKAVQAKKVLDLSKMDKSKQRVADVDKGDPTGINNKKEFSCAICNETFESFVDVCAHEAHCCGFTLLLKNASVFGKYTECET